MTRAAAKAEKPEPVTVDYPDGPVTLTPNGDPDQRFTVEVTNGAATGATMAEQAALLSLPGARLASEPAPAGADDTASGTPAGS